MLFLYLCVYINQISQSIFIPMNRSISHHSLGYAYSKNCGTRRPSIAISVPETVCSCDATTELQTELDHLRESTKEALQLSWDEVETLQAKLTRREKMIRELKKELKSTQDDLAKSKRREFDANARNAKLEHKLSKAKSSTSFPNSIFSWQQNTNSKSDPELRMGDDEDTKSTEISIRRTGFHSKENPMNVTWHHPMQRRVSFCESIEATAHSISAADGGLSELSLDMNSIHEEIPETCSNTRRGNLDGTVHSQSSALRRSNLDDTVHSQNTLDFSGKSLQSQEYFIPLEDSSSNHSDRPTINEKDATIRDLQLRLARRDNAIASMEDTIVQNIKVMQQLQMKSTSTSKEECYSL